MLSDYKKHVSGRAEYNLPPLPLTEDQVTQLVDLIIARPNDQELIELLINRVPAGVDKAAKVKVDFLTDIASGDKEITLISKKKAVFLLGTMLGGFNVDSLVELLEDDELGEDVAKALSNIILVYDSFIKVANKSKDNRFAKKVMQSWADATWFVSKPDLPEKITAIVFKVEGEVNTDDLSPASEAWSRPDIPLHAQSMLINRIENPLGTIEKLKEKGHPLAFVGDVVGTGSSRKSAINSVLWHMGEDIPYVPNNREGGIVIANKLAPIFFNTAEDSGALPIECDVSKLSMGDVIHIFPKLGKIENENGEVLTEFDLRPSTIEDEIKSRGRIPLIIGRALTDKARLHMGLPVSEVFLRPQVKDAESYGFTLAQKWLAKLVV